MNRLIIGRLTLAASLIGVTAGNALAQTPLLNVKNSSGIRTLTSNTDGSFLALGNFGVGVIPGSGTDVRLMWYPAKGAFRAGRAESGQWSDANIGSYSTATGYNNVASGDYSNAAGSGATASGASSFALGMNTSASGSASTAFGFLSHATGEVAAAFGVATTAQAYGSLVIGRYNVIAGTSNSWVDADPVFVVGNGTDAGAPANALTVLKNGRLTTAGRIHAQSEGFVFPDGTIQSTALTSSTANFANMIVKRDATGGFSAGAISARALVVEGDTGIISSGTFTLAAGGFPGAGTGTRMVWSPRRGAFRAGTANGTEWDDANVGHHSIALGYLPKADGIHALALGANTVSSGNSSVAIGVNSTATGGSSMALGSGTFASGAKSTALGYRANTNDKEGSFVYGDASSSGYVNSTADNQFMVRASGGTIFYSNFALTAGVSLAAGGGAWATISDAARKHHFTDVDGEVVLASIRAMPIREWSYKAQDTSIRHIGPTAQDFFAAFRLGESDLTITTSDIDGINLRAAQALEKRTHELQLEITALREELNALRREIAAVKASRDNRP